MNKAMRIGATVFALTMVFAACGDDDEPSTTSDEPTTAAGDETTTSVVATTSVPDVGPSATATPTDGLADGDTVSVSIAGFTPGLSLGINLCASLNGGPTGAADCDLAAIAIVESGPDGTGTGSIVVKSSPIGSNAHDCKAEGERCFLSVGELVDDPAAERSGDIDITFA